MTETTTIAAGHDIETKGKMAYCSCGWRGLAKWASELRIHVPAVMMDTTSSIITTKEYRGFQLNVLYGGGDVQVIIATAEAAAAYEAAKGIAKEIGSEVARMGESLPTIEKMITEVIYGGVEAPADTTRETEAPAVTVESAKPAQAPADTTEDAIETEPTAASIGPRPVFRHEPTAPNGRIAKCVCGQWEGRRGIFNDHVTPAVKSDAIILRKWDAQVAAAPAAVRAELTAGLKPYIIAGIEAIVAELEAGAAPAVTVESAEVEAPAPSQPQAQDDGSITGGPKATAKQISYIRSLIARHGTDDLSVGLPADLSTISRRHASQAISILRGEDA